MKEHLKKQDHVSADLDLPECLILISSFTRKHKRSVGPSATESPKWEKKNGACRVDSLMCERDSIRDLDFMCR